MYPKLLTIRIGTIFDPNLIFLQNSQKSNRFRTHRIVPFIVPSSYHGIMVRDHCTMKKRKEKMRDKKMKGHSKDKEKKKRNKKRHKEKKKQ